MKSSIMSSGSMSVRSLIDKYSGNEPSGSQSAKRKNTEQDIGVEQDIGDKQEKEDVKATHESSRGGNLDTTRGEFELLADSRRREIEQSGLLSILGPNVKSFPFSEEAFLETVKLRGEQEKTKQEYYKVELANKNLAILQQAQKAQVPPHMIPKMLVGYAQSEAASPPDSLKVPGSPGRTSRREEYTKEYSGSLMPTPVSRLGGNFSPGTRRTLSPAKIGAAAVANLVTPTTPYRGYKKSPHSFHQRHYSLPSEPSSVFSAGSKASESENIDTLHTGAIQKLGTSLGPKLQASTSSFSGTTSPNMSSTPTIQVKPSPVQSLQKPGRHPPPSQESMTSFQHIIQFHHWKPEAGQPAHPYANTTQIPTSVPSNMGMPSGSKTHKRHKSSSENMSVDLPIAVSNQITDEPLRSSKPYDESFQEDANYDDNDISMDTSAITELPGSKPSRTQDSNESVSTADNIPPSKYSRSLFPRTHEDSH